MAVAAADKLPVDKMRGFVLDRETWEKTGFGPYEDKQNKVPNIDERIRDFYLMWTFDPVTGAVATIIERIILDHLGKYTNDDEQRQEWVREKLGQIEGGWPRAVAGMLSAPFMGFYVGDQEWEQTGNEWILKRLEPLHPLSLTPSLYQTGWSINQRDPGDAIKLDKHTKRVEQILQYPEDPNKNPITLPINQVVYWPYNRRFREDTYGNSLMSRARRAWFVKTKLEVYWSIYVEKFAVPTILMYVPEGYFTDKDTGQEVANVQHIKDELMDGLVVGKGLVFEKNVGEDPPVGAEVITAQAQGGVFNEACKYWASQCFVAMLFPELLLVEPEHGSRAQADTMMEMFFLILQAIRAEMADIILQQVVRPLLFWNFGEQENLGEWAWDPLTEDDKLEWSQRFMALGNTLSRLEQSGIPLLPPDEEKMREINSDIFAPMSEISDQMRAAVKEQATAEATTVIEAEQAKAQAYAYA